MATESQTIHAAALRADAARMLAAIPDDVLSDAAQGVLQEMSPDHPLGWFALVAAVAAAGYQADVDLKGGPLAPAEEYGAAYADAVLNVVVV